VLSNIDQSWLRRRTRLDQCRAGARSLPLPAVTFREVLRQPFDPSPGSWQAKTRHGAPSCAPIHSSAVGRSANYDLNAAVLGFAYTGAGRHQQVRISEALDRDRIRRHAVLDQLGLHCLGTTHRQALIIVGRAGGRQP